MSHQLVRFPWSQHTAIPGDLRSQFPQTALCWNHTQSLKKHRPNAPPIMTAGLQNIVKPNDVALDIVIRMVDWVPHASLRRQIDYQSRLILGEYTHNSFLVRNIALRKGEMSIRHQSSESCLFQAYIIISIEIVYADYRKLFSKIRGQIRGL